MTYTVESNSMSCETCSGKVERCDECYHAAEYTRRRELKKAIRATHRGTMGDPMRPTTR